MNLPGETEAGSAGTQPCRGIAWRAHRDDERSAAASVPRSSKNPHRIGRLRFLENPRPKGVNLLSLLSKKLRSEEALRQTVSKD